MSNTCVDTVNNIEINFNVVTKKFYARLPSGREVSRATFNSLKHYILSVTSTKKVGNESLKGKTVLFFNNNKYKSGTLTGRCEKKRVPYARFSDVYYELESKNELFLVRKNQLYLMSKEVIDRALSLNNEIVELNSRLSYKRRDFSNMLGRAIPIPE